MWSIATVDLKGHDSGTIIKGAPSRDTHWGDNTGESLGSTGVVGPAQLLDPSRFTVFATCLRYHTRALQAASSVPRFQSHIGSLTSGYLRAGGFITPFNLVVLEDQSKMRDCHY